MSIDPEMTLLARKIINYFMALLLMLAPLQMVHAADGDMNCADSAKATYEALASLAGDAGAVPPSLDGSVMQDHQCSSCVPCSAAVSLALIPEQTTGVNPRPVSGKNSYTSFLSPSLRPPILSAL